MKISKYIILAFFTLQIMSAFGSTVDPSVLAQMKADLKAALDGGLIPRVNDSMQWAGGTLKRISPTEFSYHNTTNGNYETTINSSSDLVKLAKDSGSINAQWVSQYGIDLAGADSNPKENYEAYRIGIDHVLQYGLSSNYTKENPYTFTNGIAAFNDNGVVRYLLNKKVISQPDLIKSNEYKATVGSNVIADKAAAAPPVTAPTPPAPGASNNLDFIASANASSINMLIKAAKAYKAGTVSKDQLVQVALQVAGLADYSNNVGSITSAGTQVSAPAASAAAAPPAKVLIGTSNNGRDEIYVYKLNSWDAQYGYKVLIVPHDPKSPSQHPYELVIPATASTSNGSSNEAEYILNNIPKNFNVDRSADNRPVITLEEGTAGRWLSLGTETTCVNEVAVTPEPSGNCEINAKAKSVNGGWANDLKAEDKACIAKGFKKISYTTHFSCVADVFKNAGGK